MPFSRGSTQSSGIEIVQSNFNAMEDKFYKVLYARVKWNEVLPLQSIQTNIAEGAQTTSYRTSDMAGQGEFLADTAGNIPVIGVSLAQSEPIPLLVGVLGAEFDNEALRNYNFSYDSDILMEVPQFLSQGSAYHVEMCVFYGDVKYGFKSWMDYPGVPLVEAARNAANTSALWAKKSAEEMVNDVNEAISKVWSDTNEIHIPGSVWLSTGMFGLAAVRKMPDINMTVLEYVKKNNVFTTVTGQELTVKSLTHLTGAGVAGVDRMVVEEHKEENHKMGFPIPFRMTPPYQMEYGVKLISEYKLGSYHNRYPLSMVYVDFPDTPAP